MIQCTDCPHFHRRENGEATFSCDPFATIVEPECLAKWTLIKTNQMVASYQSTLEYYRKFAPLQEKMFKYMEREIDDIDESEKWRVDEEGDEGNEDQPPWDEPGPVM